jgi:hypothetical protein
MGDIVTAGAKPRVVEPLQRRDAERTHAQRDLLDAFPGFRDGQVSQLREPE